MARKKHRSTKQQRKKKDKDPFRQITWDDIECWAGSRIVARGRSYQRSGAVTDLGRTADGTIVAWVAGSERYATKVMLRDAGELASVCTCPYFATCKHAVAVVLSYLDRLKNGEDVPLVKDKDLRLEAFANRQRYLEDLEREFDEDFDDHDYDAEDEYDSLDEEADEEEWIRAVPKDRSNRIPPSLRAYLQRLTKAELVALIEEVGSQYPEVWSLLEHRQRLASGKPGKILEAVRAAIQNLKEPIWDYEDYGYGSPSVDLDRLQEQLEALLKAGQADALVHLGPELLEAAGRTVESEHEGESADELGMCIAVVFRALSQSTLPEAERIEWAIDMAVADGYSLCDEGLGAFWRQSYSQEAWKTAAGLLEKRLEGLKAPTKKDFSYQYHRNRLSNWIITALDHAGCEEQIIPLCEREAPVTGRYDRLVKYLLEAGRLEEAEQWCKRGISATESSARGVASGLRKTMQEIASRQGDPLRVVALKAEAYFNRPNLETFQELTKAAKKAGVGQQVDSWARHYLVTGQTPPGVAGRPRRKRKDDPEVPWPLPDPGIASAPNVHKSSAPMIDTLIRLAIEEKKPDEVLKWYDPKSRSSVRSRYGSLDIEVAGAVEKTHPEHAALIYQKKAEAHIATVTPRGYEAAGNFLRKMKRVLKGCGKTDHWSNYLATLREKNRRRPRCIEVLDRVATGDRPIIES